MNIEKFQKYRNLLQKYRQYVILSETTNPEFKMKLQEEVETLAEKDAEFNHMLVVVDMYYRMQSLNKYFYLEPLKKCTKETSGKLTNRDLVSLVDLYEYDPEFRNACDMDMRLQQSISYCLDEHHRRVVANDEKFMAEFLLTKLGRYELGRLGINPPIEFDETEFKLLKRQYHTDPEFRKVCDECTEYYGDSFTSVLEEHQRHTSEDKK